VCKHWAPGCVAIVSFMPYFIPQYDTVQPGKEW